MRTLLFLLLTLPAWGAELVPFEAQSRAYENRRSAELHRVYEDHKVVIREFDRTLNAIMRERKAYGSAPDPEGQLIKWQTQFVSAVKLAAEEEVLWQVDRAGVKELEAVAVTRVIRITTSTGVRKMRTIVIQVGRLIIPSARWKQGVECAGEVGSRARPRSVHLARGARQR